MQIASLAQIESQKIVMEAMSNQCFVQCVPKVNKQLTGSDKQCLERCSDKFLTAYGEVYGAFMTRLKATMNEQQ
jgi:Tim10/DDP family zinc finger